MGLKPTKVKIRLQTGTERTLFATWNWNKPNTDKYEVVWKYHTGDGVWFEGSSSTSNAKQSTYSAPANAKRVSFKVRALPTKKGKWKCGWSTAEPYDLIEVNLVAPSTPNVSLVGYKLNAVIDNYVTGDATGIQFELVEENNSTLISRPAPDALNTGYASHTWPKLEPGKSYKVRARAVIEKTTSAKNAQTKTLNNGSTKTVVYESAWSEYSENKFTGFNQVKDVSVETYSANEQTGGVRVSWTALDYFDSSADSNDVYRVEYAIDPELFDSGTISGDTTGKLNHVEITGLDLGTTFYFRVRGEAGNQNGTPGPWSEIVSMAVGTKPTPPTIWSFNDTAQFGDDLILNWVHSSDDGSKQQAAKIDITVGETTVTVNIDDDRQTYTIKTDTADHWNETFNSQIPFPTEDTQIVWKVSTKGIIDEYSDYSGEKIIYLYEPVIVNAQLYSTSKWLWDPFRFATDNIYTAKGIPDGVTDTVTEYPVKIGVTVTPETQSAISYALTITADEAYDTTDATGGNIHVSRGDVVYEGYFNADTQKPNILNVLLYPNDIDLENNIPYTLAVTVGMNSGLTGEDSKQFNVALDDEEYEVDADITIDLSNYSASIKPICRDEFGNLVTKVYFNVYRREYNGSFVAIDTNIDGELETTIIDPHPSLDYARYRIVALSKKTGSITYDDIPGYEIGMDSIVIQWSETWSDFDVDDSEELSEQPKEGSMLVLPYNIDISASHNVEVSLIEYIGNEHPTSYYGTQKGETGTWNCEIPKSDKETLYAIRRLANYMGDVYIREPSGLGYWAQITVSYSEQHNQMLVPITFNINRVTGGV